MNTYQQLEKLCKPIIKAYQTDSTIHDRQTLATYKGKFLCLCREYGTYLLRLPSTPEEVREQFMYRFLIGSQAKGFEQKDLNQFTIFNYYRRSDEKIHHFYFDGKKVKEVSEITAADHLQKWFDSLPYLTRQIKFEDPKTEILADFTRYFSARYTTIWNGSFSDRSEYVSFAIKKVKSLNDVKTDNIPAPDRHVKRFAGGDIVYYQDTPNKTIYYNFS